MQKITLKQRNTFLTRYKNGEHVARLAKDAGVSRVRFYAWIKKDALYRKELALQKKKLSPNKRKELIDRVIDGEHVSRLSHLYGISRKSIYKWLTRFQEAKKQNKPFAFENKKQFVAHYYRQAPHEYEQAVLDAVRKYPQLSSHRLPYVLPHIGNKPILGNHGVQNILRRHNLQTYEKRLSYAENYQESFIFSGIVGFVQDRLSHFLSGSTAYKERMATLGFLSFFFAIGVIVFYGSVGLFSSFTQNIWTWAMIFPLLSLAVGTIFFLYSIKYYLSIALVLSFSRHEKEVGEKENVSFWDALFGKKQTNKQEAVQAMGLMEDISHVRLSRHPFVSIHLAMYNEKHVIERLLTAATGMHYDNYEVIVADDSTDPEAILALEKWKYHPRVKIVHRETRDGYKGKALANALKYTSKRAEFIVVFDADFIPYPDSITQFLKYFQSTVGSLSPRAIRESTIAAVQGYQWHVLNKSENWITRGVRSEYAGSYVVERSSIEVYGGLKQISGSVYMVRRDVVDKVGWGESITEDFEFTLRLYAQGFKVVYTPYVQAPAEAVSTLSRLIRQRMRWAEGHSQNVKRFFWNLVLSHKMTLPEKLEFVYLSPYYLQAAFFLFGTVCWFLSEAVFQVRLPFWTEVWGWSLILTNMIALPLVNLVGLFLEESDERDYLGLLSFVGLSYVIAPFQAYAAVKGFVENKEGPWFRTPKTGRITDTFTPGHFYRYVRAFFGKPAGATVHASAQPYLALATAHNSFNKFTIKPKKLWWLGKSVIVFFLIFSMAMSSLAWQVPFTHAAANQVFLLSTPSGTDIGYPSVSTSNELNPVANTSPTTNATACIKYGKAAAGTTEMFFPTTTSCGATATSESAGARGWFLDAQSGQYPSGSWTFTVTLDSSVVSGTPGTFMLFAHVFTYDGATYTPQFYTLYKSTSQNCSVSRPARTTGTAITPSTTSTDYTWTCNSAPLVDLGTNKNLYVEYFVEINGASGSTTSTVSLIHNGNTVANGDSSVTTTTFGVPEGGWVLLPIVPFVPKIIRETPRLIKRYASYLLRKKKRRKL